MNIQLVTDRCLEQCPLYSELGLYGQGTAYSRVDFGHGHGYWTWLGQDVLDIQLPNGVVIDVGWYPESDLNGEYWVRAYKGSWDNQLIECINTADPRAVRREVERLAVSLQQDDRPQPPAIG